MIRLDNVTKKYGSETVAVRDATFDVAKGDFVFLVGLSGSGKSTLLRLMSRQERPERGDVWIAGKNVNEMPDSRVPYLRRSMGNVFQDFRLLPRRTVRENVAFALEVTGAAPELVATSTERALRIVGLARLADRYPSELSGGEQQRTAIARAIVGDPELLIADEPTGNLDPLISWEIMELLMDINRLGVTVLVATHDSDIVTTLRRRVIGLEGGRLIRDEANATYHRVG